MNDFIDIFELIMVFGTLPLMIFIGLHYRSKNKAKTAELVQSMMANDKELTPEIIQAIGFTKNKRHADLHFGLVLVAAALALVVIGAQAPDEEGLSFLQSIAAFPMFIGIATLIFWYFVSRKDED